MTGNQESRDSSAALEREISSIEEARDRLSTESHLRTLCNITLDRLRAFVDVMNKFNVDSDRNHYRHE
jgi:hypothetical protein